MVNVAKTDKNSSKKLQNPSDMLRNDFLYMLSTLRGPDSYHMTIDDDRSFIYNVQYKKRKETKDARILVSWHLWNFIVRHVYFN